MTDPSDHKQTVRRAFTKQADAYAATASVSDPERIARLVEATDVDSSDRVLEVATGPGHVAFGFADRCKSVVGVDLTRAPLEIARKTQRKRETENVDFVRSDAEDIRVRPTRSTSWFAGWRSITSNAPVGSFGRWHASVDRTELSQSGTSSLASTPTGMSIKTRSSGSAILPCSRPPNQ